ncbi:Transposon Tf2-9 polyprotein [Labeo rohita]|uniref:Gypsy retrotransposon integrase-like protein 1 n=1 Tax=Labeo rohita TaxID=84645 RepID=A0ABQ8L9G8_LABRO|nr:Transposon Tf2-9 polyprotein [Labeo rohita]
MVELIVHVDPVCDPRRNDEQSSSRPPSVYLLTLHPSRISFLGYIISPEGVAMDERKVEAVLRWPRPSTLRELQRFLGFANFYRRFIRNFSTVAAPLTAMIKKGTTRLTWSPAALQAFGNLRQRFSTAPILHHPDPDQPFVVEVDASSTGVGAVLSQRHGEPPKLFPCAYFSHKLSPAECNYDVGNRELLTIKLALEEWRHWLECAKHPFTVLTDHRNLEYLRSAKTLNHRQARWALYFTRFRFQVTYRPGSQNTKADALSRVHEPGQPTNPPEPVLPTSIIVAPVVWDILTEITEAQNQDPPPAECPANLTYVPLSLRSRVLSEVHSVPSSGHPGIEATLHLLSNRYWWPTMRLDTINFIKACTACNTAKVPRRLPAGLLQPLPVPQRPWSHIAIDFVTDLPPSNGYTTILSVVDRFSKACRFIPLPKLPSALEMAEVLCNWVFRLYGLPEDIVSDRGPQFTSRLWAAFFHLLGVNVSLTSGYHPQANGQIERLNQELTRFLRTYCQNHQEDWNRYLFWAEYAQNSLRKPSTSLTPFQCVLGFQPPLFPWSGEPSELPAVNSWFQNSEETWNQAHVHLQGAVRRTQAQADRRRRPNPPYEPGQWVWLSTRDLRLRLPCRKLSPRYVGPFKIVKQITPVSFRLELPDDYRISPTFHVSLLKPAGDPEGVEDLDEAASQGPPPVVNGSEEVYRVNTILDSRRRRGQLQYLVDWEGYGPEERSWVASGDILDPSLTTDFHTNHPDRPAPRRRGRPRRRAPPRARSRSQGGSVTTAASFDISHPPCTWDPHFRFRVYRVTSCLPPFIPRLRGLTPAKFCIVIYQFRAFSLYCYSVADWTVYSLCFDRRLPLDLFAWTIVYRSGLSLLFSFAVVDPRLPDYANKRIANGSYASDSVSSSVEDCVLAAGEIVGYDSIKSASRMNNGVVIFVDSVDKVATIVEQGVVVKDTFVEAVPLVQRGIRQGCPLSGMLYSLAFEPLLQKLRSVLRGVILPGSNIPLKLSAYADDLVVIVDNQKDIDMLTDILDQYGMISSARVNWSKSEALSLGGVLEKTLMLLADLVWRPLACAILKNLGGFGLDRALFLMESTQLNTLGLPRAGCARPRLSAACQIGPSLQGKLRRANIVTLGHVIQYTGAEMDNAHLFASHLSVTSVRWKYTVTAYFHYSVASGVERSVFHSFLWKLSVNALEVHYGIESGTEKALRVAESVEKCLVCEPPLKDKDETQTGCKQRRALPYMSHAPKQWSCSVASGTERGFDAVVEIHASKPCSVPLVSAPTLSPHHFQSHNAPRERLSSASIGMNGKCLLRPARYAVVEIHELVSVGGCSGPCATCLEKHDGPDSRVLTALTRHHAVKVASVTSSPAGGASSCKRLHQQACAKRYVAKMDQAFPDVRC